MIKGHDWLKEALQMIDESRVIEEFNSRRVPRLVQVKTFGTMCLDGCGNKQGEFLGLCAACLQKRLKALPNRPTFSQTIDPAPLPDWASKLLKECRIVKPSILPKSRRQYLSDLLADYKRTGYLHNPVGEVVKIEHQHAWKSFQRCNLWALLIALVIAVVGVVLTIVSPCFFPLWFGIIVCAFLGTFHIDNDKRKKCRCKWRFIGLAKVVTKETATVALGGLLLKVDIPIVPDDQCGYPDLWDKFKRIGRQFDVKIGDKLSREDGKKAPTLLPHQQRTKADKYRLEIAEIDRKAKIEREEKEKERIAEEKIRRERELVRAEAEAFERWKTSLRLDNWTVDPREPHVAILPSSWAPLKMVGLAYANVATKGSVPALQRYNERDQRYETVGAQSATPRGIFLVGILTQRTLNRGLTVAPSEFSYTSTNDLVRFILDENGNVRYLCNPARKEEDTLAYEEKALVSKKVQHMIGRLAPHLKTLYENTVAMPNKSGGWA